MPSRSKPTRQDGPSGRFYLIDDQAYPSVTHVLSVVAKPALVQWAAKTERALVLEASADLYEDLAGTPKMGRAAYLATLQTRVGHTKAHQRELAKAGEIGTQAHALIEWSLRKALKQEAGPEPRVSSAALWAYMGFEDWARAHHVEPVWIEQTVWSTRFGYAGTLDLLARVDGVLTVVDFKTSKAVYSEAFLQNVAYQQALIDMGHETPDAGLILRIPKDEKDPAFEAVAVPAREALWPTFMAALQLWAWWHAEEQKSKAAWQAKQAEARTA